MNQEPTGPRKACNVAALALLGIILSHYGLMWSMYGMGHTSHACNYVGYAIVILSPFIAIFLFAFIASGKATIEDGWKTSFLCGLVAFLTGPLFYFLIQNVLYQIEPTLCAFPPPIGWG